MATSPHVLICEQNQLHNAQLSAPTHGTVDEVSCPASAFIFFPELLAQVECELFPPSHDTEEILGVVTTYKLKAQLAFLRQGWFMPLDTSILSLAGEPGRGHQGGRKMPRPLDPWCPGEQNHLYCPHIRLCHPLVSYIQSFTIPSLVSCPRTSENH